MPPPRCLWQGCENVREVDSLACYLHKKPRLEIEQALVGILAATDRQYQLGVMMPEIVGMTPSEVEAIRAGRALYGIEDEVKEVL